MTSERLIVACVQQCMRVFATVGDYQNELHRFLRIAQHKHAALAIFPELGGTMLAPPMLRDSRSTLLKYAERGRRRKASLWQRYTGQAAAWIASRSRQSFVATIGACLDVAGDELWETYCELFSGLARQYHLTLIAPSGYFPDPIDGKIRNITAVFGPDGTMLGYQAKVMLYGIDKTLAVVGMDWDVIQTEVGALGILLGSDVLYPEIGRLLAYKGAEILIGQGACPSTVLYQKLRAGILARMQDNQLFAAASYLVGLNELNGRVELRYHGRSAILAPQELTPRFNGVLVEMGSQGSEGVLSADWNYLALRRLWELSDTPVRRDMAFKQIGRVVATLYARLKDAPNLLEEIHPEEPLADDHLLDKDKVIVRLEELPVISTITRRWPPAKLDYSSVEPMTADMPEIAHSPLVSEHPTDSAEIPHGDPERKPTSTAEDETEEMEALPESQIEKDKEQKD